MKRNLKRKSAKRSRALQERLSEARRDLDRIVRHIAETYQPRRIYQWGSLVDGKHFSERSDIDIALEGITDAATFFSILADAESMTRFPVDIVQMETIHPAYAESIRARGRVIYEQ
jgi:predicted nucleotidyltransferase